MGKHKRWMMRDCGPGMVEVKCPDCGFSDYIETPLKSYVAPDTVAKWLEIEYWINRNYCPNCGANMTEGDNK